MLSPRPLYQLPQILSSDSSSVVFVAEGKKVVHALNEIGLLAMTSVHGAQSPKMTDWKPLEGRDVIILPDNDDSGRK